MDPITEFAKMELRVGRIIATEVFSEARKAADVLQSISNRRLG